LLDGRQAPATVGARNANNGGTMISEMLLKFGSAPAAPASPISVSGVTVFVGPNNSGKSKILTEIESFCVNAGVNVTNKLLHSLTFTGLATADALAAIDSLKGDLRGEALQADEIIIEGRRGRMRITSTGLMEAIQHPSKYIQVFAGWFLAHFTVRLDGPNRVGLTAQQPAGDLQDRPRTTLQVLFHDDQKRTDVRRIVHEAFGSYFVIDPTALGSLRIRLSDREPTSDMEERNIHAEGISFHSQAMLIDLASDGVKAFTGLIVELIAGDPRVLLIDEPEAFLHPSLAFKLGYEVSRAAVQADKRVFASTHSPTFVMGCIQSGAPINIVRLTYRGGVATARVLPNDEIVELMRNPLLRSTGVLNGLFFEFVVVAESDADRAFYQEINERLLRFKPDWGIPNCLFLNAQGKHTVHTIIRLLRKLGIPAVGIVDVDALKEGGQTWSNFMEGADIPNMNRTALATLRANIKTAMDATGKDMKRDGGIAILQPKDREAAENLFRQLGDYGLFVVSGGELESWLKHLGAAGHGPSWLIDMFSKMGEDPDKTEYVRPGDGDVWKFILEVKKWLIDPNRRGIPS
jgi:AAA domain, putative AbiEii toxin, Type IV TA system/Overcoming lysogenization defect protein-like, TOPRIM domain